MQLSEKAYKQLDNHDGHYCLELEKNERMEDFLVREAIHFLHYHRWWDVHLIRKNLSSKTFLHRWKFINLIIDTPSSCHPS